MFGKTEKPVATSAKEAIGFLSKAPTKESPAQMEDSSQNADVASKVKALISEYGVDAVKAATEACCSADPADSTGDSTEAC